MIVHNKPTLSSEEKQAVEEVLNSAWLVQGQQVEKFENEFCHFLGIPGNHAVAVSSGTSALYLSLLALNAKKEKVSFPSYGCSALRNSVDMSQNYEDLIDSAPTNPNLDLNLLNRSNARIAIIPYLYGIPLDFAQIKNKLIIEDCSQSLGAKINNKFLGTLGEISIFSFYATKIITSGGQGGMVVSQHKEHIDFIRDYREFDCRYDHKPRFNFQMTDIQAAIGRVQLKKLPSFVKRREEIFRIYKSYGLNLLEPLESFVQPIRFKALIITKNPMEKVMALLKKDIKTIIPLEERELLDSSPLFQNAQYWSNNLLSIPIYPALSDEEAHLIAKSCKEIGL